MINNHIIAVDVDNTVVDMGPLWLEWLESVCKRTLQRTAEEGNQLDYNLCVYFKEGLEKAGMNGFEFFQHHQLYDDLLPMREAQRVLSQLNSEGYDIIFVSKIMGDHFRSKIQFCKKYFPYLKGFYGTDNHKAAVKCDVMIDDRASPLLEFPSTTHKLHFITAYKDIEYGVDSGVIPVYTWSDIYTTIKELS